MNMRCSVGLLLLLSLNVHAQRTADVNGKYTYTVGDNDNITLKEAKHKCVELAKAEAIKAEFGELITSDVIDTNAETNGESTTSFFWENTVAMAKGDWLGDTKDPVIEVAYAEGKLVFTAEVWGKAREIVQAGIEVKWEVLKEVNGKKEETMEFNKGERLYVDLISPADGYVAVYLIEGDNETSCLLPYKKDPSGRYPIRNGKKYAFFDKEVDPAATHYPLTTKFPLEYNQVVLIFSPNPFTKCIETVRDARHPNSLSTREFQKWLLKCQRSDRDMVVKKKWVQIKNPNAEQNNIITNKKQ